MTDQPPPRPYRHRHDGLTPERQAQFCAAVQQTGFLSHAAHAVGLSMQTINHGRKRMPAFDAACTAALAGARAADRPAEVALPLHATLREQAMAKLEAGESGAATLLRLALDAERTFAAEQQRLAPRVTAEHTDRSILRKLAAMRKADLRQAAKEAERLLLEGKIP